MAQTTKEKKQASVMMEHLIKISPLHRMIVSPGLDETFSVIKEKYPEMTIHEYPTGLEIEDWIIPQSWEVKHGHLKSKNGNVIGSTDENHLFVVPYSEEVEGWFTKEEIGKHLSTRKDMPEEYALELRNAYDYRVSDWGISLPHNRWENLKSDQKYHVSIEVNNNPGKMKVAEYFRPGKKKETICFCAHIDELCNDDLSGCVVAMELIPFLDNLRDPLYSYQVLIVPEMFGMLYYIGHNKDRVANMTGMVQLESLGAGETLCLKKSLVEDSLVERVLRMAITSENVPFEEMKFFEGYGNDERVIAWPTLNIPGVALQRYPFPEYHTSADTVDIIQEDLLVEALQISEKVVEILEENIVYRYTNTLQPWLTKHGLYYDCHKEPERFQKFANTILFHINGKRSVLDLAGLADVDIFDVSQYLKRFLEQGLVQKVE